MVAGVVPAVIWLVILFIAGVEPSLAVAIALLVLCFCAAVLGRLIDANADDNRYRDP